MDRDEPAEDSPLHGNRPPQDLSAARRPRSIRAGAAGPNPPQSRSRNLWRSAYAQSPKNWPWSSRAAFRPRSDRGPPGKASGHHRASKAGRGYPAASRKRPRKSFARHPEGIGQTLAALGVIEPGTEAKRAPRQTAEPATRLPGDRDEADHGTVVPSHDHLLAVLNGLDQAGKVRLGLVDAYLHRTMIGQSDQFVNHPKLARRH